MKSLILNLKSTRKGSEDFDDAVAVAFDWYRNPTAGTFVDGRISWSPPNAWGGGPWGTPLPKYSTSMDDSYTLIPKGWYLRLTQIRFGLWHVELWDGDKSVNTPADIDAIASTPSLTICAAALQIKEMEKRLVNERSN